MPIYEFECSQCGKRFEVKTSVEECAGMVCDCGGTAKRVVSAFSFTFIQPNTPRSRVNPNARPVRG